jgi:putative transposase
MPRWHRVTPAGFVYHVLNRGTNRSRIFIDQTDYLEFCRLLVTAAARTTMRVIAYCLMPNHWHLVLWPLHDDAISEFVHWLALRHATYFRRRTKTVGEGHVYQERFRCFPVETSKYYYNVVRYVEANARRAGLVDKAEDWPWSSLAERLQPEACVSPTSEQPVIVPGPLPLPTGWRTLVNLRPPSAELDALRTSAETGRPYGSENWIKEAGPHQTLEHPLRRSRRPVSTGMATPEGDEIALSCG